MPAIPALTLIQIREGRETARLTFAKGVGAKHVK